jgi:hypothetical protein
MSDVGVIWARAPSLEKLEKELARGLAGCVADDVLAVSHSAAPVADKQSGGIWSGSTRAQKLEYSALVLVRSQ